VTSQTLSGFTLQWRNLNGSNCIVTGATSVNWYAVPAQ
jgi:hypothetical protein